MMRLFRWLFGCLEWTFILYLLVCGLLYRFQEKVLFHPKKLDSNHEFVFDIPHKERMIRMSDGTYLNALFFPSGGVEGLIFLVHGNAGSLEGWGTIAATYTELGYDVLMYDYRGFGKSRGHIENMDQLFSDAQTVYSSILKRHPEEEIVVIGYSLGSGIAAHLASKNQPRMLILEAPYYSLGDMMHRHYPLVPKVLLRYPIATHEYLLQCRMPVALIHGDSDRSIPYESSRMLERECAAVDTLITLQGQGHNGIEKHPDYVLALKGLLDESRFKEFGLTTAERSTPK